MDAQVDKSRITGASQLEAFSKVAEGTALCKRQFTKWEDVTTAGKAAYECGTVSRTLEELERFKPSLNGLITITVRQGESSSLAAEKYHLLNRLIEGYAEADNIEDVEEAIKLASMLQMDNGWLAYAEQALLKAAVPHLKKPEHVIDFAYALKSDKSRDVLRLALSINRIPPPIIK